MDCVLFSDIFSTCTFDRSPACVYVSSSRVKKGITRVEDSFESSAEVYANPAAPTTSSCPSLRHQTDKNLQLASLRQFSLSRNLIIRARLSSSIIITAAHQFHLFIKDDVDREDYWYRFR